MAGEFKQHPGTKSEKFGALVAAVLHHHHVLVLAATFNFSMIPKDLSATSTGFCLIVWK